MSPNHVRKKYLHIEENPLSQCCLAHLSVAYSSKVLVNIIFLEHV